MRPKDFSVRHIQTYDGHRGAVYSLAYDAESQVVFSGGGDGFIARWNMMQGADGELVAELNSPVWKLFFDPISGLLLAGSESGHLFLLNLSSGKGKFKSVFSHANGVFAITRCCESWVTGGGDGVLRFWDEQLHPVQSVRLSEKSIRTILPISPHTLMVGCSDGGVYEVNHEGKIVNSVKRHKKSVFCLAWNPAQSLLYSGGLDAVIHSWEWQSGLKHQQVNAHLLHIHDMAINPPLNLLASVSMDKSIKFWNPEDMTLLKVVNKDKMECHNYCINAIQWIAPYAFVTSGDDRKCMRFMVDIR
jgi:WD40 repeat protein